MRSRIGLALVASCVALAGCKDKKAVQARPEVVGESTIRDAVRLTGTVEPLDSVEIKSEVSGRILKVLVREGDAVKQGQPILLLDTVPFLLARDKAQLQVDRASLAQRSAQRELGRARDLAATGTVTKNQLEDLQTALERTELDLREARLSQRNAELDLSRCRIRAPMEGHLIRLAAEPGEVAASAVGLSGGTSLGTIADPSRLKVVVEVGELDYARLRLAMPVRISTEGGRPRTGHVSFIPSSARASVDTKTIKVFPVEVVVDGEVAGILPGMTVGVDFVFLEKTVSVSVPYEALQAKPAGDRSRWGKGKDAGAKADSASAPVAARAGGDSLRAAAGGARGTRQGGNGWAKGGAPDGHPRGRRAEGADTASPRTDSAKAAVSTGGRPGTVLVRGPKGEFEPRPVKVGVTDFRRTEILEGLAPGDTVWIMDESGSSQGKGQAGRGPGGPGGFR